MPEKTASDFRYNTGESQVPWSAVGENYSVDDVMEMLRFLIKGDGVEYQSKLEQIKEHVQDLSTIGDPPGKLSLGDKVLELEEKRANQVQLIYPEEKFYHPPLEVVIMESKRKIRGHFNIIHHDTGSNLRYISFLNEHTAYLRQAWISSLVNSGKSRTISSSVIPEAKYSSTSETVIRIPRIQGFPLRFPGSIVMISA